MHRPIRHRPIRFGLFLCLVCVLLLLFSACGGGGGGGTGGGPTGDFSLSASPGSVALSAGQSQSITVAATEVNGFSGNINVTVTGLPSGVSANPASFSVMGGSQFQVSIMAGASAQPVTTTVTFQGISGNLSHGAQLSFAVVAPVTGSHPPLRTRYLRTNSFYDPNSLQFAPPHFTAYDPVHKQFFVSNPFLNEVDVFDATSEIETAEIPVPFAWGLDVSPSNGSLYVGTLIGDIYQIDTATMAVTTRYPTASIGPQGFVATTALVLADGRLALQGGSGQITVLGVDGNGVSAVWDPVGNTLDTGSNGSVCDVGNEGAFALSGDRTRILASTVDEGGGGETVCSYDPVAKIATYGTFPYPTFVRQIVSSPDGSRFFLTSNLNGVGVFDAETAQLLGQITGLNAAGGAVISLDGKTLYLVDQSSGAVAAFDTTSFAQIGWVPSFTIVDAQSFLVVSAIDATGLIAGPMGHGVGFLDASQITGAQPTGVNSAYATPATGPQTGDTTIAGFATGTVVGGSAKLSQIYVGNVPGAFATFTGKPGYLPTAQVTTPPNAQTGAVDLTTLLSDGGLGLTPEGFSYGPTILEVVPNGATAEGGQLGTIIGYGFGNSQSTIQVTVGGQSAAITGVYSAPIIPYPVPAQAVQFTIPPGIGGTAVNVKVTTSSGSSTATGAFHYTAAIQTYPIAANLQAGIYDPLRNLYYFADQAKIQVFSPSARSWLAPITLPGVSSKTQLLAISESPDGSKLAVSDFGGQTIFVLDPGNSTSVQIYPMSLDTDGYAASIAPGGLAITNNGLVYFNTADINGTGTPSFHKLNTSTNSIVDIGGFQSAGGNDEFNRVLLSPDGTKVYSSASGGVSYGFWLDIATNKLYFSTSSLFGTGFPDLAVSGDGSTVDVSGQFADSLLNFQVDGSYIDWETWFPLAANGQKLNQDGSILFQPLTDGIDLISRNTGRLEYRVQIPVTPANVYDSLVVAPGQNTVAVISANGLSFVDLSSLPIPGGLAPSSINRTPFSKAPVSTSLPTPDARRVMAFNSSWTRPRLKRGSQRPNKRSIAPSRLE